MENKTPCCNCLKNGWICSDTPIHNSFIYAMKSLKIDKETFANFKGFIVDYNHTHYQSIDRNYVSKTNGITQREFSSKQKEFLNKSKLC